MSKSRRATTSVAKSKRKENSALQFGGIKSMIYYELLEFDYSTADLY